MDRRVTLVAADTDARVVDRAAELWMVADEARAGAPFTPEYVKEQSAGVIDPGEIVGRADAADR